MPVTLGGGMTIEKAGLGEAGFAPFHPLAVETILHLGGVVGWGELGHGGVSLPSGKAIEKPAKEI